MGIPRSWDITKLALVILSLATTSNNSPRALASGCAGEREVERSGDRHADNIALAIVIVPDQDDEPILVVAALLIRYLSDEDDIPEEKVDGHSIIL
jgi:hypothetical protein